MQVTGTEAFMTEQELDDLLEYSTSVPTGVRVGKRWKRAMVPAQLPGVPTQWLMGEYVAGIMSDVAIHWRRIVVEKRPEAARAPVAVRRAPDLNMEED